MKKLIVTLLVLPVLAQAKTYQLKELIQIVKKHPEIQIAQFEVAKSETLFDRIRGETGPKVSLVAGIAPNKATTGNALSSSTSSNIDTQTLVTQIDLKWPLFMFGRSNDLNRAAKLNETIKKVDQKKVEAELIKKLKEYYFGFQYASSLNDFADSTLKDLDDAIEGLKENKKNSKEDMIKLSIFRSLAQAKKFEVEKGLAQAVLGLRYITQDQSSDGPSIEQNWIEFQPRKISSIEEIEKNLSSTNFDLIKVEKGVEAKDSYLKSEKKSQLPVFGLFSKYDWMKTNKATEQASNFANDPYNKNDFVVGVGIIYDLDFGVKSSKVAEASIDLEQMKYQREFAKNNIPYKVEKIYLEVIEAQKKSIELQRSYKEAKKLLANIASGVAIGVTPAKEIIESYALKAQVYKDYLEAVYNYELKLSELSFEVGTELDPSLI